MEWWQVVAVIGGVLFGAVILRLLWVAAFRPRETVAPVPVLDGYVPGDRSSRVADAGVYDDNHADDDQVDDNHDDPDRADDDHVDVGTHHSDADLVLGDDAADLGPPDDESSRVGVEDLTPGSGAYSDHSVYGVAGYGGEGGAADDVDDGDAGIDEDTLDDRGGPWIELDIEPLFPSSDGSPTRLVDLTEENEPEATL